MHTHAKLIRTLVLGGLIAGCLSCLVPSTADAKIWESEEHNVLISIPDSPAPWIWLPAGQDWSKYGIVKGATRTIEELKSGEKPKGEHGLMHLIMRDAKEGETLESIVADGDTVETLMQRFGSKADWPELESLKTSLNDDVPAVVLTASGKALNSKTGEYTRCEGRMLVTTVLGKVYFLRMYAWHTEYDGEGLKLDLDMIEGDFELLKTTGEEKPERPKDEPEAGAGDGPEPDEAKEETIDLREYGLRLVKHKKLTRVEPDQDEMLVKLEGNDGRGYYVFTLYAVDNSRIINGQQAPPFDIKEWITTTWWKNFMPSHPEGEIYTYKFPKRDYITLPELEKPKHIAGGDKKRPIDPSSSDIMKKLKAVEKSKAKKIGKEKVIEPFRGVLQGNRPRWGKEIIVRFAWRTAFHSFRLVISIGGEGDTKYGEALQATLESMEHYDD